MKLWYFDLIWFSLLTDLWSGPWLCSLGLQLTISNAIYFFLPTWVLNFHYFGLFTLVLFVIITFAKIKIINTDVSVKNKMNDHWFQMKHSFGRKRTVAQKGKIYCRYTGLTDEGTADQLQKLKQWVYVLLDFSYNLSVLYFTRQPPNVFCL